MRYIHVFLNVLETMYSHDLMCHLIYDLQLCITERHDLMGDIYIYITH